MRGGWVAGLIELCVYLLGFTVTGRLVAREMQGDPDGPLAVVVLAIIWPLVAALFAAVGAVRGLAWLLGVRGE